MYNVRLKSNMAYGLVFRAFKQMTMDLIPL